MIKFLMSNGDRKILGIVITDGNIEKLKEGHPIHFSAEEMTLPDIHVNEIVMMYYASEEEAYKTMKAAGLIRKETVIHELKKPKPH